MAEQMRGFDSLPSGKAPDAENPLGQEFLNAVEKARKRNTKAADSETTNTGMTEARTSGKNTSNNGIADNRTADTRTAEQRTAEERSQFEDRFHTQNFVLPPLQPGWGPFQSLEQMVKEHKIELTDDQLLHESRRIRDRDFKDNGRNYYDKKDIITRWSESEIGNKVQETMKRVKGIDVSMYQEEIDWQKVKDSGIQFAFIRTTKGTDLVDPNFAENRESGAHDVGLKLGYYHYFKPDQPVDAQVKAFAGTVGKPESDILRLVVDTENDKIWKPFTVEQRLKMIEDFCQGVKKELGVKPEIMIYGSPSFFKDSLANSSELSKHDLWIANYKVAEPTIPKPWSNWKYWQYSETGKVPGIKGNVDLDMYNGSSFPNSKNLQK